MRTIFLLFAAAIFPVAAQAQIASYAVVCASACVVADGTTQPAGTVVNIINAAPGFNPGPNLALVPFTGQKVYQSTIPVTIMPLASFMQLLTSAQRQGLWAKMVSDTGLADAWWAWISAVASNGGIVNVTDPALTALLSYCVSKSYITQANMNSLLLLQPG